MKKIIFLALVLIAFAFPIAAFGVDEDCGDEGECIEGDCENGRGTYVFTDGSSYSGAWQDGLPDGFGALKFLDGSKQEGEWRNGSFTGER